MVAGLGALYALILAAGAGARFLRPRAALRRPVVPVPALRGGRAGGRRARLAAPLHPALEAPSLTSEGTRRRRNPTGRAPLGSTGAGRRSSPRSARPRARWTAWGADRRPAPTCFRLNFSHGTRDEHAENVAMAPRGGEAGRPRGRPARRPARPKLRLDDVEGRSSSSRRAQRSRSTTGEERRAPPTDLPGVLGRPSRGRRTRARRSTWRTGGSGCACCEAPASESRARSRSAARSPPTRGSTCPGPTCRCPSASRTDLDWVDFAVEQEIDLLAVSFVRRAEDLQPVERRVRVAGADIPLIAKIEKPQAAENAEAIIRAAIGGIMVARGDLGIEIPIERVPMVQKTPARARRPPLAPSITATQMLASMVSSHRPTRAEVSDVANAIFQGTDAVMLSEETAVGEYPVEAVRVMDRIAREAEPDLPYGDWVFNRAAGDANGRRQLGGPGRGGLHLHARPRRPRRPDAQRAHGAARLRASPEGPGARRHAADRDGAAAQPPVRRAAACSPRTGPACARSSTTARGSAKDAGVAESGRPDRRSPPGLPRAGARHEPVRDPPGAVSGTRRSV